ncbi:hypothetical protein GV67_06790 [Pseudorhizobium pelagicum]|nr:hypothetical protein GV67_06790 [Pseudorhizobium pelagicum]
MLKSRLTKAKKWCAYVKNKLMAPRQLRHPFLGCRQDPNDPRDTDLSDPRIKTAVIITAPGVADMETAAPDRSPSLRHNSVGSTAGPLW